MSETPMKREWSYDEGDVPTRKKMRSTSAQIQHLVNYMDEHRDLAFGCIKSGTQDNTELWENLTEALSMLGPTKTPEQWKITWRDLKSRAKNAMANSTTEVPVLSHMDRVILSILGNTTEDKLSLADLNFEKPICPVPKPKPTAKPKTTSKSQAKPTSDIQSTAVPQSRLKIVKRIKLPIVFLPGPQNSGEMPEIHPLPVPAGSAQGVISQPDPLHSQGYFTEKSPSATPPDSPEPSVSPPQSPESSHGSHGHRRQSIHTGMPLWAAAAAEMEQNRMETDQRLTRVLQKLAASVTRMSQTLDTRLEEINNTLNTNLSRIVDKLERRSDNS